MDDDVKQKIKDLAYEVLDNIDVCIKALETINGNDSNPVATVLKENFQKINGIVNLAD